MYILKNQRLPINYYKLSLVSANKTISYNSNLFLLFHYNIITRVRERCTQIVVGQLANLDLSKICIHCVKCYVYFSRDTLGCNCLSTTGESPTSLIFIHKNIDSKKEIDLYSFEEINKKYLKNNQVRLNNLKNLIIID